LTGRFIYAKIRLYFWENRMTLLEEDLVSALKELLETAEIMTSGTHFSAEDMERFQRSKAWAKRVVSLAEPSEAFRENSNQISLL
jgi:hypothetical protein